MRDKFMMLAVGFALFVPCGGSLAAFAQDVDRDRETSASDFVDRMAEEHAGDHPVPTPLGASSVRENGTRELAGAEVVYATLPTVDPQPGTPELVELRGFAVEPADAKAAVLLIHEWWGLNDNIRSVARRLAAEGFATLAVDLYEGEVAEDRQQARSLMQIAGERPRRALRNLGQAIDWLESKGFEKVGVIGWCFGGGWSLKTAIEHSGRIDATAIYYGRLITDPEVLRPLASPVLGIFGGLDGGIPVASVEAFETALKSLGKPAQIKVYPEADHAFANPSGTRYRERDAEDAWKTTVDFFSLNLLETAVE